MTALHKMNAISFAIVVPVLAKPFHDCAPAHRDTSGENLFTVLNHDIEATSGPLKDQVKVDCSKVLVNVCLGLTIIRLWFSYKICRVMPKCTYQACIFY
jgi:hypothetical protein